jgi:hypothetical protein
MFGEFKALSVLYVADFCTSDLPNMQLICVCTEHAKITAAYFEKSTSE